MFPTPSGEMFSPRLNWRSALIGVLMFLMGVGSVVFADRLHMEASTSESRQDRADLRRDVEHLKSDKVSREEFTMLRDEIHSMDAKLDRILTDKH